MAIFRKEPIYIVGHINPDTDSVCSAIAYAHFLRERTGRSHIYPARAGPLNSETKFVLKTFRQKEPLLLKTARKKKLIIVDHNEVDLALPDIRKANILEIIDHHRIGDVETIHPIEFVNQPRGSTASIIAERYRWFRIPITKSMAGVMLSALLSDTIMLNSPTTTRKDRTLAKRLAEIAGVNLHRYGRKMLEAGCDLINHSPRKIILTDFKTFRKDKTKIGIGQVNVADTRVAFHKKHSIFLEMEKLRKKHDFKYIFLMITNIVSLQTDLLVSGDDLAPVRKVFKKKMENNMMILPKTVSRKKQIQPKALELLKLL